MYENSEAAGSVGLPPLLAFASYLATTKGGQDEILATLVAFVARDTAIEACLVLLQDGAGHLAVRAAFPERQPERIAFDEASWPLWERIAEQLADKRQVSLSSQDRGARARLGAQLALPAVPDCVVPLCAGGVYLGLLLCHLKDSPVQTGAEVGAFLRVVAVLASQALLIQQQESRAEALDTLEEFFRLFLSKDAISEELFRRQAVRAGLTLGSAHTLICAEIELPRADQPASVAQVIAARIRHQLQERWPRALVQVQEGVLFCLVPEQDPAVLERALRQVYLQCREIGTLRIGIGNAHADLASLRMQGKSEALEALDVGRRLYPGGGVTLFRELGLMRYVYWEGSAHQRPGAPEDPYQLALKRIGAWDARERTELLRTLTVYFDQSMHGQRTADALGIHPNTLRQRLQRIQSLCEAEGIQFGTNGPFHWLSLQVALQFYRAHPVSS